MKRSTIAILISLIAYMSFFWIVLSSIKEKYGFDSVAALIGVIGCVGLLFFIGLNKPFDKWLKGLDGVFPIETVYVGDGYKYVGMLKNDAPWKGAMYDADGDCINTYREGESLNKLVKVGRIR